MVSRLLPRARSRRAVDRTVGWRPRRPGGRSLRIARVVAPVVFLLAVTGIVLLVRSALRPQASTGGTATAPTASHEPASRAPSRPPAPKRYYVIASGDTLGAIAARFATTVAELQRLNPGIEPTALHPGEQIRIR